MSLATNGGCDDRVSTNKSLCVFEVHTRGRCYTVSVSSRLNLTLPPPPPPRTATGTGTGTGPVRYRHIRTGPGAGTGTSTGTGTGTGAGTTGTGGGGAPDTRDSLGAPGYESVTNPPLTLPPHCRLRFPPDTFASHTSHERFPPRQNSKVVHLFHAPQYRTIDSDTSLFESVRVFLLPACCCTSSCGPRLQLIDTRLYLDIDGLLHVVVTRLKEHLEQVLDWTHETITSGYADASTVGVHVAVTPATRRFIDKHRPVIVLFN